MPNTHQVQHSQLYAQHYQLYTGHLVTAVKLVLFYIQAEESEIYKSSSIKISVGKKKPAFKRIGINLANA
jgi:hypothetical protein